jgi:hypothetical protein
MSGGTLFLPTQVQLAWFTTDFQIFEKRGDTEVMKKEGEGRILCYIAFSRCPHLIQYVAENERNPF